MKNSKRKSTSAKARVRGAHRARPAKAEREPRVRLRVDERRTQLVELGLARFGTEPYDDVSIDDIAHAAGISKGLLYHYFSTKRAFYLACVRVAAARLLDVTASPAATTPLEHLYDGLDAYLGYVRAHAGPFATLMRGVANDPEIAAVVDQTRTSFVGRLTTGLTTMTDRSVLLPATPRVRIALRGWVGMAEATSVAWVEALTADANTAPTQAEVREWLAIGLMDVVRRMQ